MDLFKMLGDWIGGGDKKKKEQAAAQAQQLQNAKKAATMPKVLNAQGQQQWRQANNVTAPSAAKPMIKAPSVQQPEIGLKSFNQPEPPKPATPKPLVTQSQPPKPINKPLETPFVRQNTIPNKTPAKPMTTQQMVDGTVKGVGEVGKFLLGGTAKTLNTGIGGIATAGNALGAGTAKLFQDEAGKKRIDQSTAQFNKDVDSALLGEGRGLFGTGGYIKSGEFGKIGAMNALGKGIGAGALTAAETAPISAGTQLIKGASPVFNKVIANTGIGVGSGALGSAGSQYAETGKVEADQLALDAAAGGLFGAAIPAAAESVRGIGQKIDNRAAQSIENRSTQAMANPALQNEIAPQPTRPAVTPATTPERTQQRAIAIETGTITPETRLLSPQERVATAINSQNNNMGSDAPDIQGARSASNGMNSDINNMNLADNVTDAATTDIIAPRQMSNQPTPEAQRQMLQETIAYRPLPQQDGTYRPGQYDSPQVSNAIDDMQTQLSKESPTGLLSGERSNSFNRNIPESVNNANNALELQARADLSKYNPEQKRLIKEDIERIAYERKPELFHADEMNTGVQGRILGEGGTNDIPRMHVKDLRKYFGNLAQDIPASYKRTTGKEDLDQLAARAGFDDVSDYVEAIVDTLSARKTIRDSKKELASLRKDPEVVAEARAKFDAENADSPNTTQIKRVDTEEFDNLTNEAYRRKESATIEKGKIEAEVTAKKSETDEYIQKERTRVAQEKQVNEAIERGFNNGPRHKVDDIINKAAELGFVPKKKVTQLVNEYAEKNGYSIANGRAFKKVNETPTLDGDDGRIKRLDELTPDDETVKRINKPGVKSAIPYGDVRADDMVRQMVYKNDDGSVGEFFEYRTPQGKWRKSGLDAIAVKSPNSTAKIQKIKDDASVNQEAKRAYDTGTTAQYIWRENDAGVHSEFIREFDAAMGDASKLEKVDSNKIVSFDPDKHYIEAGKVVDSSTGQILGNYIEITPDGVNMFAGRQRISLNYNELNLSDISEMKTPGLTWTTEGIIDRITGNRVHTNGVNYFKKGGDRTKESLMHIMVDEPRAAQRKILDEDNALGNAVNDWEDAFNKTVAKSKRADMRRDAVYVIEPAKVPKGEKVQDFDSRLSNFKDNYGESAANTLKDYDKFMRGVYDNLLVRMNKERVAIGQPAIKRRNNYITHIAEMADGGIIRQGIQGINNLIGGDVMMDARGALPSSITGTTGTRKPKSKYNPFSMERLADNKPLNPFDPIRVYSSLALQNIHMTKAITLNRSLETAVRGLSEAKQEMSGTRGIEFVSELLDEVVDKASNGNANTDDYTTLSKKMFGLTQVYKDIEGIDGLQRTLRKAAKSEDPLNADDIEILRNSAEKISSQLDSKIADVDSLNTIKKDADALHQFVGIVQEHTNKLAGKTNHIIRGMKDLEKSKGTEFALLVAKGAQQHAALTGIVGNLSSAINQALATPLVMGTTRPQYQLAGLKLLNDEKLMKKSDALWLRYKESLLAKKSNFQKAMDIGGIPLLTVEKNVMKWTFASKYSEGIGKGLDERQAIKYAERFIGDTTSWRDVASAPRAYDRPIPASLLQFTREVTQQYRGFWNRFTPKEKVGALIATMVVTNGLAAVTGNKSGTDPLGALVESGVDILGFNDASRTEKDNSDNKEDSTEANSAWAKAVRAGQNTLSEVVSAVPIASSAANTFLTKDARADVFGEDSNLGRYEGNMALFSALGNAVKGGVNVVTGNNDQAWKDFVKTLPMGSQLQKTASGVQAMIQGYTKTSSGKVRTTVDQNNPLNWLLAPLFGTNAIIEQRKSFEDGNKGFTQDQQTVFDKIKQSGGDAIGYANTKLNSNTSATDTKGMSELEADKELKIEKGDWKEQDGSIVNKDGEVQRQYYKDIAYSKTDKSDSTYEAYLKGFKLEDGTKYGKDKSFTTGSGTLDSLLSANSKSGGGEGSLASKAVSLFSDKTTYEKVPDWVKDRYYKDAGFGKDQVEYAAIANVDATTKLDNYYRPIAEKADKKGLMDELFRGRRQSIQDNKLQAQDSIITSLQKEGYLTKDEAKYLKGIKLEWGGKETKESAAENATKKASGSGKKEGKKGSLGTDYTSQDISDFVRSSGTGYTTDIQRILNSVKSKGSGSSSVTAKKPAMRSYSAKRSKTGAASGKLSKTALG